MNEYLKAFDEAMDIGELKQILKDAPEGATHYGEETGYYKVEDYKLYLWVDYL